MNFIEYCNAHRLGVNRSLWCLSCIPLAYITGLFYADLVGENPFEFLMNHTGHWAMFFFTFTLAITPMRRWLRFFCKARRLPYGKRMSDWNFLIHNRRMLGLLSFYYACFHGLTYLYFEIDFDWNELLYDISSRIHIILGISAWALLFLLAITSPTRIQIALRRNWRRIHRAIYVIAILLVCHLIYEAKLLDWYIQLYLFIIFVLLSHRVIVYLFKSMKSKGDTGMEASR